MKVLAGFLVLAALAATFLVPPAVHAAAPQETAHAELRQFVDQVRGRMSEELAAGERVALTPQTVLAFLDESERAYLSTAFVQFEVDRPARLFVAYDHSHGETPFWLPELGFERRPDLDFIVDVEDPYHVWEAPVPAGQVALGIPGFSGEMKPYVVLAAPAAGKGKVELTPRVPGTDVVTARVGERLFIDDDDEFRTLPGELVGLPVLRSYESWELVSRMVGFFRQTDHPSSAEPDHLQLTWEGDPRTSVTIQWRTDDSIDTGKLWIAPKSEFFSGGPDTGRRVAASYSELLSPQVVNDPAIRLHRVRLDDLAPGSDYVYSVSVDGIRWTAPREFRTAAERGAEPYSFIYLGDAQNGLDEWGKLLRQADFKVPEARFYMIAGDLVDKGAERDNWDQFFHEGSPVFDSSFIVPAVGNHDSHAGHPTLYLKQFALPDNGTPRLDPGRTYHVTYQDLLVVVMDSNYELVEPELQVEWLDRVLGESEARWKVVIYHHPFYASRPDRDNFPLRETWGRVFDKHEVDIAFQGHDHAYMRTVPMRAHQPSAEGEHGTIYLVAVSGMKMYVQELPDFAAFGATNTRSYQVIDIDPAAGTLDYRAIDTQGRVIDRFSLSKD